MTSLRYGITDPIVKATTVKQNKLKISEITKEETTHIPTKNWTFNHVLLGDALLPLPEANVLDILQKKIKMGSYAQLISIGSENSPTTSKWI